MKHLFSITIFLSFLILTSCSGQQKVADEKQNSEQTTAEKKPVVTSGDQKNVTAADIPVYTFEPFQKLLSSESDTTFIINFWATWCKPCVEELPYFEAYHEKYKSEKVKVLLVSLDFPKQIEKKVVPFINDRNLQPEVIILDEADPNSWIDKVDPEWSGAIPITIIFKGDKRGFFERSFESLEDVEATVASVVSR